jgi:hypothetical protein
MRISTRPRRRNSPRPAEKNAPAFLQWLRGRECLFVGKGECSGRMEAMHLDFAGGKGIGTKVADKFSVPACSGHHGTQHRIGWSTFVALMATSKERLLEAAGDYWHLWPGRRSWEAKHGA